MRLINEDAVLEIIERVTNEAVEKKQPKYLIQPRIIAEISGLPTIEAEPVKHGRWIEKTDYNGDTYYDCSDCEESWTTIEGTPSENGMNYCPNCGARMDGDSDDEP